MQNRFHVRDRYQLRDLANERTYDNALEALQVNQMNWDVGLEPIQTTAGRAAPGFAVCRQDNGNPLSVVGSRYATRNNREASEWLDLYKPHGMEITGAEMFKGGQRCVMYADIKTATAEVKPGDTVKLQLVASWSHDGSSHVTGALRVIRLVCLNGLCMAGESASMFDLRHTRNAKLPSDEVIQANVRQALAKYSHTIDAFRHLANRPAQTERVREYVREVLELDSEHELKARGRNILDGIVQRFHSQASVMGQLLAGHELREERVMEASAGLLDTIIAKHTGAAIGHDGAETWWTAYNAVTEFLTHERGRTEETRKESLLFGESARINERALQSALSYAN